MAGVLLITAAFTQRAEGSVIINISQVGANVVFTGSGTINLAALSFAFTNSAIGNIIPNFGQAIVGPAGASFDLYFGVSGPFFSYGPGNGIIESSGSGNFFDVDRQFISVPQGYVSGAALSGSATFNNATFSSLGITPGTYVATWGTGPTADSFTVNAGIPEPGSLSLIAVGLLLTGLRMRNRNIKNR